MSLQMRSHKIRRFFLDFSIDASPAKLFILSLMAIFTAELVVTYVIYNIYRMPIYVKSSLDVFLTTLLVTFTLYLTLFHPMRRLIAERNKAIDELKLEQDRLDQNVRKRTAELAQAYRKLQFLSHRIADTQEAERRNLSRELHDGFGQALTSVMVKLTFIEQQLNYQKSVKVDFTELYQLIQNMLEDIHCIAIGLHPAALDQLGLVAALRQYLETTQNTNSMKVEFVSLGITERLPYDIEISLFRIAQEAVTNVIRHAKANRLDVLLEKADNRLILVVEDDGVGFDPGAAAQSDRLGVYGMSERAKTIGGILSIESHVGQGTTLQVEILYGD